MTKTTTGPTKDKGYQVGVRRTFDISPEDAWEFLWSQSGGEIWLGNINMGCIETGSWFTTKEGTESRITTFRPGSHFRMKYKLSNWDNMSTLQVRIIPNNDKTTISFHQEDLSDSQQRQDMRDYWHSVLDMMSMAI